MILDRELNGWKLFCRYGSGWEVRGPNNIARRFTNRIEAEKWFLEKANAMTEIDDLRGKRVTKFELSS